MESPSSCCRKATVCRQRNPGHRCPTPAHGSAPTNMNFTSDNCYGASAELLDAIARANGGAAASYGDHADTARLQTLFSEFFEREVSVFPVISGTAANALSMAT